MAAAFAEASNDSSRDMQIAKENSLDTLNIANETNVVESNGEWNTARVNGEAVSATTTTKAYAISAIAASAAESDDDDDGCDATMHTPSASPGVSFDAGAVITKATTADVVTTTGSDSGSAISITSKASAVTASSDESENATMPQWKKELIQRRKANIARTIGANQPGACPQKGTTSPSTTMAAGIATPVSPTSPVLSIAKNFCNDSTFIRSKISTPTSNNNSNNGGSSTVSVNNGVNARTPDIVHHQQHDASSGGHYTAYSYQQQEQQQLPCVDADNSNHSSQVATSSPIFAKPKTSCADVNTGNDGNDDASSSHGSTTKCPSGGITPSRGSSGTCLTTSPLYELTRLPVPLSPSRLNQSQSQQQFDSVGLHQSSSSIPSQLHSRLDAERAGEASLSLSLSSPQSQSESESCNIAATGTTTASFIKNPYVNKSTNKFSKYKSATSAKSSGAAAAGPSANVHSVTANVINSVSANSSNSNSASVTNARNSARSAKMVAAQDLSEVNDGFDDFDPSEELQYGPGIVSKLRCRYLSLALRQSAGKQRPALDNLRRATSLNNLLDDDDRGSNSSCTTGGDHTAAVAHATVRPSSENLGKSPDEFVATFQKNLKLSDKQRSRHVKRGNDSMKRARSVEALLVYGDKAWENDSPTVTAMGAPVQMRYSYIQRLDSTKTDLTTSISPPAAEITIEDKIISARERNSITDKPPRKITPFMDETERPPPDVVKQTLKIFEATANKRGRGLSRNNCNGEVATKVRNYKSIISQEKPPIIFPKPPLSPKKAYRKPGTPPGNLDMVAAKKMVAAQQQHIPNGNGVAAKKQPSFTTGSVSPGLTSPINSISKKLNNISAELVSNNDSIPHTADSLSPTAEPKNVSPPVPSVRTTIPFRLNAKNESTPIRTTYDDGGSSHSPHITPDVIPRKMFDSGPNFGAAGESPVTQLTKQIERLKIESPAAQLSTSASSAPISPSVGTISPIAKVPQKSVRSSESEDGDEDDSVDSEIFPKRVSKSALDNISKAGTTQQFNFSNAHKSSHHLSNRINGTSNASAVSPQSAVVNSVKQIGVIRPLLAEPKLQQQQQSSDNSKLKHISPNASPAALLDLTSSTDDLITAKARDNLVISNLSQQQLHQQQPQLNNLSSKVNNTNATSSYSSNNSRSNQIDEPVAAPIVLQPQPPQRPTLTSREIEKNLINTKKIEEANLLEAAANNSTTSSSTSNTTSTNDNNGVKWQLTKKKVRQAAASSGSGSSGPQQAQQLPQQPTQNTMIFNFKDRKEVPDYIENDGLLFRRKRELPKPNESGFVLLGDLSLETSTDPDDDWTMGPPSPCDVEFENANIIIDGKSSIRSKSREISLRVQFDDTLTSTFEYPSESSMHDDTVDLATMNIVNSETLANNIITATATTTTMPTSIIANNSTTTTTTEENYQKNPGQKLLGSMSLGSAPLGSYIPMKAQINTSFELGVTRNPDTETSETNSTKTNGNSSDNDNNTTSTSKTKNSCNSNGIDYIMNGSSCNSDEPESLQYLKPATDDLTVAYSEGTQKTDLLY